VCARKRYTAKELHREREEESERKIERERERERERKNLVCVIEGV